MQKLVRSVIRQQLNLLNNTSSCKTKHICPILKLIYVIHASNVRKELESADRSYKRRILDVNPSLIKCKCEA